MSKLIHIIGTSGSGKDSVHPILNKKLTADGYEVINIVEPGPLRDLAKSYRLRENKNPYTELAIFSTDRLITFIDKIENRLNDKIESKNLIYLSARGILDTYVYQGLLGGVDFDIIAKFNKHIPMPDLTLCLTCDPEVAYDRIRERSLKTGEPISKNETPERIRLLRDFYNDLKKCFTNLNIKYINTTKFTIDKTANLCYNKIKTFLENEKKN